MKQLSTSLLLLLLFCGITQAQGPGYTANDIVKPYTGNAFFACNMGYYENWTDEQLADIAAGNPELGIEGIGIQALRPTLPDWFLEEFGYDVRLSTFQHYQKLGLKDNTCFLESPSDLHRETAIYCGNEQSHLFANIYLPIWDNGENGTPINDDNFYAAYVYKTVSMYKDYVKFWEIWNEPDFCYNSDSTKPRGEEGNWWENNPDPCDYKLKAPIFHYIRTLRISYEVIKSLSPDSYVALGGLGYPSFLDGLLRNTDNPNEGEVTAEYPLSGGAYFDVMSYHSYPHIDGSLREWNNDKGGFDYFRHSDAAVKGVLDLRDEFREVLHNYSYNGTVYPKKLWIITEANVPRAKFYDDQGNYYIGSEDAQINFVMKSMMECKKEGIEQYHIFNLSEANSLGVDVNEFQFMGLYKPISPAQPYNQKMNKSGVGYYTTSVMLANSTYDSERTKGLKMPEGVNGGAFRDANGEYTYALWVETTTDEVEDMSMMYSFPATDWEVDFVELRKWNFAQTKIVSTVSSQEIQLTSRPTFFKAVPNYEPPTEMFLLRTFPNPFTDYINIGYFLKNKSQLTVEIADVTGRLREEIINEQSHPEGAYQINYQTDALPEGIYIIRLMTTNEIISEKIFKHYKE